MRTSAFLKFHVRQWNASARGRTAHDHSTTSVQKRSAGNSAVEYIAATKSPQQRAFSTADPGCARRWKGIVADPGPAPHLTGSGRGLGPRLVQFLVAVDQAVVPVEALQF